MDILVTGGTGFIGSHTAVALLRAGHRVRLLVRSKSKMERVFGELNATADSFETGDITDAAAVGRALEDCQAVVHTAGMVSTARKDREKVHQTNVGGTHNVIEQALAKGVPRIIHVSSITALFHPDAHRIDEQSPPGVATSAYGRSKIECERYVRRLQDEGAPIVITYPTSVVGPQDPGFTEPLQGLAFFVTRGTLITSSGLQIVDNRDLADVHCRLFEQPVGADRFMVGGHYYPWRNLADTLDRLTGKRLFRLHAPPLLLKVLGRILDTIKRIKDLDLPADSEAVAYATRWGYADSSKLETKLGFRFRDGEDSLADTLIWLAQSGHLKESRIGKLARKA